MNKLILIIALLLVGCGEAGPSQPKDVALDDIESLRDQPGADGCKPHTYRSPVSYKGMDIMTECDDASTML